MNSFMRVKNLPIVILWANSIVFIMVFKNRFALSVIYNILTPFTISPYLKPIKSAAFEHISMRVW